MSFVKLHGTILDSSVWGAPHATRIVWITLLAMADEHGIVGASVGGLAHRARVTVEECEAALAAFLGPEKDSRDGTTGERIAKVEGGWLVLNHRNYRDRRTREQILTAKRVAAHRERVLASKQPRNDVTPSNEGSRAVTGDNDASASASASVQGGTGTRGRERERGGAEKPDDVSQQTWDDWVAHRKLKKSSRSVTVITKLRKDAEAAGMTLDEAMAHCVSQGHQGFYPPAKGRTDGGPRDKPIDFSKLDYGKGIRPL